MGMCVCVCVSCEGKQHEWSLHMLVALPLSRMVPCKGYSHGLGQAWTSPGEVMLL